MYRVVQYFGADVKKPEVREMYGVQLSIFKGKSPLRFWFSIVLYNLAFSFVWPLNVVYTLLLFIFRASKGQKPTSTQFVTLQRLYPFFELNALGFCLLLLGFHAGHYFWGFSSAWLYGISYLAIGYASIVILLYFINGRNLWARLKTSALRVVPSFFIISVAILLLFTLSYAVLLFGTALDMSLYVKSLIEFIGISKLRLWIFQEIPSLSTLDILISLDSLLYSTTIIGSVWYVLKTKRIDADFLILTKEYLLLGDIDKANTTLQKVARRDSRLLYSAIIALHRAKVTTAIKQMTSYYRQTLKRDAFLDDLVAIILLGKSNSYKISAAAKESLWEELLKKDYHALSYFMLLSSNPLAHQGLTLRDMFSRQLPKINDLAQSDLRYAHLAQIITNEPPLEIFTSNKEIATHAIMDLLFKYQIFTTYFCKGSQTGEGRTVFIGYTLELLALIENKLSPRSRITEILFSFIIIHYSESIFVGVFPEVLPKLNEVQQRLQQLLQEDKFYDIKELVDQKYFIKDLYQAQ
ncbi:MAG: hypothetical protein ABNH00_10405 [Dokdonia sp.]|jgi:hypothetical protein